MDLLAYIDPNTIQQFIGGPLGPFLGWLLLFLGILIWPLKMAVRFLRQRYSVLSFRGKILTSSITIAILAGGTVVFFGGHKTNQQKPKPPVSAAAERVIVLGMDGLDPHIMEDMMARGELPHFQTLALSGTFRRMQTSNPPESPVAWSSIATGCGPGQHGIFDFLHRDPQNYQPLLSMRQARQGLFETTYEKARKRDGFWVYTSQAKIPTTVIRWPVAFPAEEVTGHFLSGLGVPDLLGGEGRYAYYTTAPLVRDDPSAASVVSVTWEDDVVHTEIQGPAMTKTTSAKLALAIRRLNAEEVRLEIEGAPAVKAKIGTWTPFIRLAFPLNPWRKVYGLIKFLPVSVEPDLRLYATPINLDCAAPVYDFTYPHALAAELQERIGPYHTLGMPEPVQSLNHKRFDSDAFLLECAVITAERRKMLEFELDAFDKGLLAFVFDTSDRIQHAFWAMRDPAHPAYDPALARKYKDVIPGMYRDMDEILGQVLARVDARTLLLVISDHGFTSFRRAVHLNRWLIDNGYQELTGGNKQEGGELFQNVDWSRTRAYALGFSSIYLNLAGREAKGIVTAGEYEKLQMEISERLRECKDPDTGAPVFENVYRAQDIYSGPARDDGPDLVVGMKSGYRASWQTALGGAPLVLVEDNKKPWSGDHLVDPSCVPAVLFCNRKLAAEDPRVIDIAPTVLQALGVKQPEHMTGRSLLLAAPAPCPDPSGSSPALQ